jgi:PAS domain S-box-containing protein
MAMRMTIPSIEALPGEASTLPRHDRLGHVIQLYNEDGPLLDLLSRFVGSALTGNDAAVVIAVKAHTAGITERLAARGLDVPKAIREGRYMLLDAAETLAKFMVDGLPDARRFADFVGGTIVRAKAAAQGERQRAAVVGEMVSLLWAAGNIEGALRLEQLWNDLARTHAFSLRCAYPMSGFNREKHSEPFWKICAEHSDVIPTESYTALISEEERHRAVARWQQRAEALETQMTLGRSRELLQLLVEAVQDYAIFMLDPGGHVTSWNKGAERLKGYKASEIIGKHFSCFYPEDGVRSGKPERGLALAARDGRFEDEGWRKRKDGSLFWANVVITPIKDDSGALVGFGKVTRDFTERMDAQEALRKVNRELKGEIEERIQAQRKLLDSEESLRQLSRRLLSTQDEERRRIGRDLHDSVGQYLLILKMKLDLLESYVETGATARASQDIGECARLAEDCIKEVRTLSYLLYPPMLEEMGLKSAIVWYLDGFSKRSGIKTTFDASTDSRRFPREVELALFRILQESLTNVHRHSASPTADVRLLVKGGDAILEVSDKGKGMPNGGFEETNGAGVLGIGLRSMSERARQVGGTLEVKSSSAGTTVTALIPFK